MNSRYFLRRFLLGGLVLLLLTYCHSPLQPYQTERFDLTAGPAAAEGYPMEVVEGRFITSDGNRIPISPDFLEGDWGVSHTTYVSGDGMAPAPDSLEARWFSYTEDKFYEGQWILPQQRIHDLLKQGYWNATEQKHETYEKLIICFLPKGVAVVWLAGRNQVLLGRYQAKETAFDFKRFNEAANRPRMIAQEQAKLPVAVQAQIRAGTLSTQPWDSYLKTYSWKVAFSQPLKLNDYAFYSFSAEADNYPLTPALLGPRAQALLSAHPRPIPENLLLVVDAGYGRKREINLKSFDEEETLAAFQSLHAARPAVPLTLYVETDERVTKARVFVKNDQQQVELSKVDIAVYEGQ